MRWSIEAREPFLDIDLINFVYSKVPLHLKLKWIDDNKKMINKNKLKPEDYSEIHDIPKYILKKVSERYLPNEVIYRRKEGFPIELNSWHNDMVSLFDSMYNQQDLLKFNKESLKIFLSDKTNSQKIWMINNVLMFCKNV